MGGLFLSHSHRDKSIVRLLASDLKAAGVQVWHDEDRIARGDRHIRKIEKALGTVEYVAACLSPHSIKSSWVKKEIDVALASEIIDRAVVVLPFLLKDCPIPLLLRDKLFFDFTKPDQYEEEFRKLVERLKSDAEEFSSFFAIDASRSERIVRAATVKPPIQASDDSEAQNWIRNWVINYLADAIGKRIDGFERHWIYLALGRIGGPEAESLLRQGLADKDAFARSGAQKGLKLMDRLPQPEKGAR